MSNFVAPKSLWIGKLCYACIKLERDVEAADLMLPVKIIDFIPGNLHLVSVLLPGDSQRWLRTRDLFDHIDGNIVELHPPQGAEPIQAGTCRLFPYADLIAYCKEVIDKDREDALFWRKPESSPVLRKLKNTVDAICKSRDFANTPEKPLNENARNQARSAPPAKKTGRSDDLLAAAHAAEVALTFLLSPNDQKSETFLSHNFWPKRALNQLRDAIDAQVANHPPHSEEPPPEKPVKTNSSLLKAARAAEAMLDALICDGPGPRRALQKLRDAIDAETATPSSGDEEASPETV
jgi:hypothetical protein